MIEGLRIEPATLDDLPELTELLFELFSQESDFIPNREKEMRGLRLCWSSHRAGGYLSCAAQADHWNDQLAYYD